VSLIVELTHISACHHHRCHLWK